MIVAVELSDRELLIPSALPSDKPNLPHSVFPDNLVSADRGGRERGREIEGERKGEERGGV